MYWIVFILFPGVLSKITINIFAGPNPRVEAFGAQTDVISDTERDTFQVNDADLKEAANLYYGRSPTDIFVKGPTPWDDLYKRYNWTEISRTLKPKNAKIFNFTSEQTVIASKNFHNEGLDPANYSATVTQSREITVSHFWTGISYATVTEDIEYSINLENYGLPNIFDQNPFLEERSNITTVNFGQDYSKNITLQAGETAVAVLTATKKEINVEIVFEAFINGSAAANYALTYRGHHFWSYDIETLQDAANLPKTVSWIETITVGFTVDEEVLIFTLNGTRIQ